MERQYRGSGALWRSHGDEGQTTRPAAFARKRETDFGDIAMRGKPALQLLFGGSWGEIAYVEFSIHDLDLAWRLGRFGVRRELPGKSEEMVGNLLVGLVFGCFALAQPFKMPGDGGYGTSSFR